MGASTTETAAEALSDAIRAAGDTSATEQELLIKVEAALSPVLDSLDIPKHPQYEKTLLQGRADSVYGSVTIEYEAPGKLATAPGRAETFAQCRRYLREQAEIASPGAPEDALPKLAAVTLDGHQIGFVLWRRSDGEADGDLPDISARRSQLTLETEEGILGQFEEIGPTEVTPDSITDFLLYLRALSRRPLEAESLAEEFGPSAATAREAVGALAGALRGDTCARTRMLYEEWLRLFGAVYGEPSKVKKRAIAELATAYALEDDDIGRMLFAVHTYFALIMKLLALELVALQGGSVVEPFVTGLSGATDQDFESRFEELESGSVFRARGIENFLEGDFLGWYIDEWSPDLRRAVREVCRQLQAYEPATATLRPDLTQDLLKSLYHRLLPKQLRHDLGEYYTPDWLAQYVMDRADYEGTPGTRLLDPACGSGTFLVEAVRRMKDRAIQDGLDAPATASALVGGVVGFDLNPLAVIAARTNYLLAAGDLVRAIAPFRIPVYICDSITVPSLRNPGLDGVRLTTSASEFTVPERLAAPEKLPGIASALEFAADNDFSPAEFLQRVGDGEPDLSENEQASLRTLYEQIVQLRGEGRDGIWPRLLSNAFAPLFARESFDYVIGNPPWIAWESVSPDYREATKPLWFEHGLFTLSGGAARLGGGKKDLSILMTMVALEEYLRPGGALTFLITQTVFQTMGAGDGFRRFRTKNRPVKVRAADDLANFNPFEDAANWTAVISLERDAETTYPVPYVVWNRLSGARLGPAFSLPMAMNATERHELLARPVVSGSPTSPWLIGTESALSDARYVIGESEYTAKAGVTVWLDGVFQVEALGMRPDGLVHIRNYADVGKTDLAQVEDAIEPDLLFPYVPWANISRWQAEPDRFLLIPQDPETRAPFPEDQMRSRWPRTYAYLRRFEDELGERSGYKRYFNPTDPFYAIYNVARETMAEWKVVWQTMGSEMTAAVVGPSPDAANRDTQPTVFKNTVIFVPVTSEAEGWYLSGLLNSTWANYVLRASNVRGGKSSFATNVLQRLRIPRFAAKNNSSRVLAEYASSAAGLAKTGGDELLYAEHQLDNTAARIWGLSEKSQDGMREVLDLLH